MKILFTTDRSSWISKTIRLILGTKYSHLAMQHRGKIINGEFNGLELLDPKKFFKRNKITKAYKFKLKTNTKKFKICYNRLMKLVGTPYDYKALVGFIFVLLFKRIGIKIKNPFGDKNEIFCSEVLYIFIQYCIKEGLIKENILNGYHRESFSPKKAEELINNNSKYFAKGE